MLATARKSSQWWLRFFADFGKIDILINNAGIGMRKPFAETSVDTIEEIMRINYLGMVYFAHRPPPAVDDRPAAVVILLIFHPSRE